MKDYLWLAHRVGAPLPKYLVGVSLGEALHAATKAGKHEVLGFKMSGRCETNGEQWRLPKQHAKGLKQLELTPLIAAALRAIVYGGDDTAMGTEPTKAAYQKLTKTSGGPSELGIFQMLAVEESDELAAAWQARDYMAWREALAHAMGQSLMAAHWARERAKAAATASAARPRRRR